MVHRLTNARHWIPWVYLAIVVISAVSTTALYFKSKDQTRHIKSLVVENQKRIVENRSLLVRIQKSRLTSCTQTWIRITKILIRSQTSRTRNDPRRERVFQQLLEIADPHQCAEQVKPAKKKG